MEVEEEIENNLEKLTEEDWNELRDLHETVISHHGSFIVPNESEPADNEVIEMGPPVTVPVVWATMRYLYEHDLIVPFAWGEWDEGREIFKRQGDDRFDDIDPVTAVKLLIAIARNDRFVDGAWAHLFESGDAGLLLGRVLRYREL